ncbi:hypothetical protein ABH935_007366 [Catenulispora sp. GAS73]|uniref:NucA/NucB deoxyribonuclease domain-containing protein n=1 Tax=Catenulispora sp. GAS73 TaxID=3156269 RepID=UPI003514EA77
MRARPLKRRSPFVLAVLTLAIGACLSLTGAAPVSAATPASFAQTALKLPPQPAFQPDSAQPGQTSDSCPAVRAGLRQYAAHGITKVSCLTVTPGPAQTTPPQPGARLIKPAVGSWCGSQTGIWLYSRTENCIVGFKLVETVFDANTGAQLGTANISVNQDVILSTTSNVINENDSVTWVSATGRADVPGTLIYSGACTAPCTYSSFSNKVVDSFYVGKTVNAQFQYSDSPGATSPDTFSTFYTLATETPGVALIKPATWRMPVAVRCDNMLANRNPGCVFPASVPTLYLSEARYGPAAVNVQVAEQYLAGAPGTTTSPLTRGNPALSQGNRDAICDSTFIPDPTNVPTDSCDEYPFASSQQSGGTRGLTGKNCLEIVPGYVNGHGTVSFVNQPTGTQQCERGHVPLAQNKAVGSQLSALYSVFRMLQGDPYTVFVTV